jgi:hypothetical protein
MDVCYVLNVMNVSYAKDTEDVALFIALFIGCLIYLREIII